MRQAKIAKNAHFELNEAYLRVLYWFFAYPAKEISLNDLTKFAGISKTTANKIASQLARSGFLKINAVGKVWRISCNQQHQFNTARKIPHNLELVYESGILQKILSIIPNARSIILFGSYRKGDDLDTSDLDIAVETLDDEETKIIHIGAIPKLGYRRNVQVNLLKFSRSKIDLNLFSNLCNGIVLYGFLEARP